MRAIVAVTTLCASLAATQALGDAGHYTCTHGDSTRTIAVTANGAAGHACEVQYAKSRDGGHEVLWHAAKGAGFCAERARAFVERLHSAGWSCAQDAGPAASNNLPQPFSVAAAVAGGTGPDDTEAVAPTATGVTAAVHPQGARAAAVPAAPSGLSGFQLRGSIH